MSLGVLKKAILASEGDALGLKHKIQQPFSMATTARPSILHGPGVMPPTL
jgi:hypothetical protein